MHHRIALLAALLALCWPIAGSAQAEPSHPSFTAAPHLGVLIPQPFSDLGSYPVVGLELGYVLPFDTSSFVRPASIVFDVLATSPGAEGDAFDPNLGEDGAGYSWSLTQKTLILELTTLWRFMPPKDDVVVYGQFGPRFYFIESVLEAESGANDFGEHRETNIESGLIFAAGVELALGPGAFFGALEVVFSELGEQITGNSSNSALSLDLGYRLMF